jgi:hypothetical protein
MTENSFSPSWKITYWTLFAAWITGVAMYMWRVHGGFLTNYLADLAFPPWYYIVMRGILTGGKKPYLLRWFGFSSERAAISIFLAGVVYEFGQRYRIIPGTFDLWDIIAYGIGLCVIYLLEKRALSSVELSKF